MNDNDLPDFAAFDARARDHIARFGRTVISVFDEPAFTYSIGNSFNNLPELIVFCLHPDDAMNMVNYWSDLMMTRGREFSHGEIIKAEGAKTGCLALHCPPDVRANYTMQATRYLGHADYRVVQMIVPDPAGAFPPSCNPAYARQPILG